MNPALVPLYVMGVFLLLMAGLIVLAVRSSRRGLRWNEDDVDHD